MTWRIRAFEESDAADVARLWDAVFPEPAPRNRPDRVIRDKLAVQRDLFFVAEIDGGIAGTAMGGYDGHRGWVYTVAVHPERQRQGIGAALINEVERALVARGCLKINLQIVAGNSGVVAFYEKLGYAVEKRVSMGKIVRAPHVSARE